jgi:signal peptidase I
MKTILQQLRDLISNKWFKFTTVSICYLLWVLWNHSFVLLLGEAIVFDIYISKKVQWAFWKLIKPKSKMQEKFLEWVDAIIFAVVAASVIRLYFVEAYTIPTASMEKTLLIGDYLFVSKFNYGPRTPNTPIAFPFVHHTMPFSKTMKSFSTLIQLDYYRLGGLEKIKNDDVVVFNFPEGDTVVLQHQDQSYYQIVRELGRENVMQNFEIGVRPVDKQENYIKRCVGIPGNTIQVINGVLYVNGKMQQDIATRQYNYVVQTNGSEINERVFDELGISIADRHEIQPGVYIIPMSAEKAATLKQLPNVVNIAPNLRKKGDKADYIFPHDNLYNWNEDFFGPLYLPKRGVAIQLNTNVLPLYRRAIETYEHNKLEVKGKDIYINGKLAKTYKFKMDYYWMMGDNRHNSADSRFWGFVPEDHIVGKAAFIWMSVDADKSFPANIRWSRLFRFVHHN